MITTISPILMMIVALSDSKTSLTHLLYARYTITCISVNTDINDTKKIRNISGVLKKNRGLQMNMR